jgi:antitoxin (DNA-binding transcriptional repressor) of toxin-antitoxin stability system
LLACARLALSEVDLRQQEVKLKLNMKTPLRTINTKQLRMEMGRIVEKTRQGASFLVLHRSRPAFQIIPVEAEATASSPLESDPLYRAEALGQSKDGLTAAEHDRALYRR